MSGVASIISIVLNRSTWKKKMTTLVSFLTVTVGLTFHILVTAATPTPIIEYELFREYTTSVSEEGHVCAQFGVLPASVKPCGE
jgi:hypothetical protein